MVDQRLVERIVGLNGLESPERVHGGSTRLHDTLDLEKLIWRVPADRLAGEEYVGGVGGEWDGVQETIRHVQLVDRQLGGLLSL